MNSYLRSIWFFESTGQALGDVVIYRLTGFYLYRCVGANLYFFICKWSKWICTIKTCWIFIVDRWKCPEEFCIKSVVNMATIFAWNAILKSAAATEYKMMAVIFWKNLNQPTWCKKLLEKLKVKLYNKQSKRNSRFETCTRIHTLISHQHDEKKHQHNHSFANMIYHKNVTIIKSPTKRRHHHDCIKLFVLTLVTQTWDLVSNNMNSLYKMHRKETLNKLKKLSMEWQNNINKY